MIEITIIGAIILVTGLFYHYLPRFREIRQLNKTIDRLNKCYGTDMFSPGVLLLSSSGLYGATKTAPENIPEFVQTVVKDLTFPSSILEFHNAFMSVGPVKVGTIVGNDAGHWNIITYAYKFHTVIFYISVE